jgi:hypothetical protein
MFGCIAKCDFSVFLMIVSGFQNQLGKYFFVRRGHKSFRNDGLILPPIIWKKLKLPYIGVKMSTFKIYTKIIH